MRPLSVAKRQLFVLFLTVFLLGYTTSTAAIQKCHSLSLRQLNADRNWRQKILRIALLETSRNGNTSVSVGNEKHGVAFLLVDPNMSSMTMFISDLPSKLVPGPAIIQGEEGEAIVSYLINNTFVASNPTGLAFAGVVPLSIASIEALQANPTRFIFVWKQVKRMILQVESCCLRKLHNFYRPFYSLTLCSWRTQASTHPLPYPSTFMHEGR